MRQAHVVAGILQTVMVVGMISGCSDREESPSASAPTNSAAVKVVRVLTPEQKAAAVMRDYLDGGDIREALMRARGLMDSKDREVRAEVVGVLDWIGRRAMPELAEMMGDADSEIAHDAMMAWDRACGELRYEELKAAEIAKIVPKISDPAMIDSILMNMTDFKPELALTTLDGIIIATRGRVASACAKEMFEHLACEPWDSTARTQAIIASMKDKKGNMEGK